MDEAQQRRERLKRLREQVQTKEQQHNLESSNIQSIGDGQIQTQNGDNQLQPKQQQIRLRNYQPQNKNLKFEKVPQAKPQEYEKPENQPQKDDQEIFNDVGQQKVNWDLKRAIEKKLAKLERRTQKALVEMVLEKKQLEQQQQDSNHT